MKAESLAPPSGPTKPASGHLSLETANKLKNNTQNININDIKDVLWNYYQQDALYPAIEDSPEELEDEEYLEFEEHAKDILKFAIKNHITDPEQAVIAHDQSFDLYKSLGVSVNEDIKVNEDDLSAAIVGYVAVSFSKEENSGEISGLTLKGKPLTNFKIQNPDQFMKDVRFTTDKIEQKLIEIGHKHSWDSIDQGRGMGYNELFFDTRKPYTVKTQNVLADNIVKTVNEINQFFNNINRTLISIGLPSYEFGVWQEMGPRNGPQIEDLKKISNLAGSTSKVVYAVIAPDDEIVSRDLPSLEHAVATAKKLIDDYIEAGYTKKDSFRIAQYDPESEEDDPFINTVKSIPSVKKSGMTEAKAKKQRLDPKCWTGYRKAGTKVKGGVRVNKCVKVGEGWEAEMAKLITLLENK